jgi:hypothetical protein
MTRRWRRPSRVAVGRGRVDVAVAGLQRACDRRLRLLGRNLVAAEAEPGDRVPVAQRQRGNRRGAHGVCVHRDAAPSDLSQQAQHARFRQRRGELIVAGRAWVGEQVPAARVTGTNRKNKSIVIALPGGSLRGGPLLLARTGPRAPARGRRRSRRVSDGS